MGWKGAVRSINAANNRAIKERERNQRATAKESAKLNQKLSQIQERRDKIQEALKNDLASGKTTDTEYARLSGRMSDITDELLVFGKAAAVALGKRYVCGKIERDEFEKLRAELVPKELYQEKGLALAQVKAIQSKIEEFKKSCTATENACSKCKKQKGFLRRLRDTDGLMLCGACTRSFASLKQYEGYNGVYIAARPCEVKDNMTLSMTIHSRYF